MYHDTLVPLLSFAIHFFVSKHIKDNGPIYIYKYIIWAMVLQIVIYQLEPHKAVAEVSKIGNL